MNSNKSATAKPEMVGVFSNRQQFEAAVAALYEAGFTHADLSVLSSHDPIDVAGKPGKPWRDALTALVGELKFEGPLLASGIIYLAGGPVSGTIAALVGATVGGLAAKEVLDEVTSSPDTEDFARALEAGSVILWVHAPEAGRQDETRRIMETHGAENIHLHGGQSSAGES